MKKQTTKKKVNWEFVTDESKYSPSVTSSTSPSVSLATETTSFPPLIKRYMKKKKINKEVYKLIKKSGFLKVFKWLSKE